jgi:Fungalysin metallopeptidase (M36)
MGRNHRALLYVIEGLKNTACSPTFVDARNGVIDAAVNNFSGEDVCTLWEVFADFGLGTNAVSGGSNSTSPTNGFDVPLACQPGHTCARCQHQSAGRRRLVQPEGEQVGLQATANDAEDGDLTGSIGWTSNLDGALGTGGSISITTLSPGNHTVTGTVTDTSGLSGSDFRLITVSPPPGACAAEIDFENGVAGLTGLGAQRHSAQSFGPFLYLLLKNIFPNQRTSTQPTAGRASTLPQKFIDLVYCSHQSS